MKIDLHVPEHMTQADIAQMLTEHSERLVTEEWAAVEQARVSHVQWVASRVADIADELRTHAQMRVEDRVDQLVDLRNRAEPVIDAAEAVVEAAHRGEEIEEYIAALRRIAGNLDTPTDEEEDEGQDEDPAGDCDA